MKDKNLHDFLPNKNSSYNKKFQNTKIFTNIKKNQVIECIRTVMDPEIPVNIVELGLIYDLKINDLGDEKEVIIKMTLTAPGCGMGPVIADEVDRKINGLKGVKKVAVELVWEPMWNRDMMSEEAQLELGMM